MRTFSPFHEELTQYASNLPQKLKKPESFPKTKKRQNQRCPTIVQWVCSRYFSSYRACLKLLVVGIAIGVLVVIAGNDFTEE